MRSFSIPDFQTFIWLIEVFVEERESHRLQDFHTNLRQSGPNFQHQTWPPEVCPFLQDGKSESEGKVDPVSKVVLLPEQAIGSVTVKDRASKIEEAQSEIGNADDIVHPHPGLQIALVHALHGHVRMKLAVVQCADGCALEDQQFGF